VGRFRYEVVATLGPATPGAASARELLRAGATALRLNTSHISRPELERWLEGLRPLAGDARLYLDLQGSKWRVGRFPAAPLAEKARVELFLGAEAGATGAVPVPHEDFFRAAAASDGRVLLDDARIELRLETVGGDRAVATVERAGTLQPRKGITLPSTPFRREGLTDPDSAVVALGGALPGIRYAVSYVKDAPEMTGYREVIGRGCFVAAKIERASAVADVAAIARVSDEIWICRGDLGAEMGLAAMAEAVHDLSGAVGSLRAPALLAGQVLEHMTRHPAPTRAEVCHLYDALARGFAGVVLSDETAVGEHPVDSVRTAAMWR
jgi:pyruvate kinase